MKLLLDQNLSRRLVVHLAEGFPESQHVAEVGLDRADDDRVWHYACSNGYVLVSKDTDFLNRALLDDAGGKLVYLRTGNCTSPRIRELLATHTAEILTFAADPEASVLTLG